MAVREGRTAKGKVIYILKEAGEKRKRAGQARSVRPGRGP